VNPNQNHPPYPYFANPLYPPNYPPSAGEPGYRESPYTGTLGSYKTEREVQLERQLMQADATIKALETHNSDLKRDLTISQNTIYRWRLNIRNSTIAGLSIFITLWATVSILVQYPVLPWDMPNAVYHLFTH